MTAQEALDNALKAEFRAKEMRMVGDLAAARALAFEAESWFEEAAEIERAGETRQ